jgi:hypothetical protein
MFGRVRSQLELELKMERCYLYLRSLPKCFGHVLKWSSRTLVAGLGHARAAALRVGVSIPNFIPRLESLSRCPMCNAQCAMPNVVRILVSMPHAILHVDSTRWSRRRKDLGSNPNSKLAPIEQCFLSFDKVKGRRDRKLPPVLTT